MDLELEKQLKETVDLLRQASIEEINLDQMDPVAKMMLVALLHEGQKIRDYIDSAPQKMVERYCTDFIPYEKVGAVPAIALLKPDFKLRKDTDLVTVGAGAAFSYKMGTNKQQLNYIPLFETTLVPCSDIFLITRNRMTYGLGTYPISMDVSNHLWVGIVSKVEIDCLQGLSLLIRGTGGVMPEHIIVGMEHKRLDFSTMREMENIQMVEPFDAQQASGQYFSFINTWKECLLNMDDAGLLYITDSEQNRDRFKPKPYPRVFQQWLEDDALDRFNPATVWLQLVFPEGYNVPDTCEVSVNVLPVVNVDVNSLMLTQAAPIAKLQKQEDSFFLRVLETSTTSYQQGFSKNEDEIIVRDFDASSYNNGDLYRDVRTLYNRFIDDYYAFIEYNGIKDGEGLRRLREAVNRLGKNVGETNEKFKFDSGTYVMRNMSQENQSTSTKVSFMTTMGYIGNEPKAGDLMESKKLPSLEQKVPVVVSAMGGADKASVDARYELLRYYALTNDRLYTRMDIDAFLRKEIMLEFGKEEFHRIFIRISIQGAGGDKFLRRGLYIDIEFKDRKNYDHAVQKSFDTLMRQRIENLSCIAMPIIIKLKNMEGQEL